jgi:hypothetical protein
MAFREQSEKLSQDEKSKISNLDDFFAPCQVLVLWFPDGNVQYLICAHDDGRKDMEMEIEGPIPLYEAVDKMESILKDPKWNRNLSEKEKEHIYGATTFSEILEGHFLNMIQEIRNVSFQKPPKTSLVGSKFMLTMRSFRWTIRGNIAQMDEMKMVNEILEQAKKESARAKTEAPTAPQAKPIIKGWSTFFYPRIWVGKLPRKTFKEKVFGSFIFPEKALDLEYKGKVVIINQDGLIAIGEESVQKAARMLNEIMATFLLLGIEANAVRELEVGDATIDPSSKTLTSWSTRADTPRTQFLFPFSAEPPPWQPVLEIEKERLIKVIQQAELITKDPDISDFLIFFLEANTHLKNSEYAQSFIMSWVITERHVFWLWDKFLKEEGIPRKRRDKLMNPAYWTIDYILEGLNLGRQLSQKDYEELMSLKNKRNDIIHGGEAVNLEEATKCLDLARNIVKQRASI